MAQPETRLQKKMVYRLRRRGAWCHKIPGGPTKRGLPDILFTYRGQGGAIEVKMPGKKPTPNQAANLRAIARAGGWACVFTRAASVEHLLSVIDKELDG